MPQPPQRRADSHPQIGRSLSGTNLERAGDHNQRVTLQIIRVHGLVTRADIADITGLTPPAIANITKRLLTDGLIMEVGRLHGARGQPAMQLAINPDGCFSIGVNIDRDHITVVGLDLLGKVRARESRAVELSTPETVASCVRSDIQKVLDDGKINSSRVLGVGIAVPDDLGRVNLPHGMHRYDSWKNIEIQDLFGQILPLPVFVENDAAAAALGELQFGHGLQHPSFFYILISEGLGGGLVIEGQYCRGAQGRSGEIGFLPVRLANHAVCPLQEIVSLAGLHDYLARAGFPIERPQDIPTLGVDGQSAVHRWLDLAAEALVEPLINVNCLINPNAVYLGGQLPAELVDELAERLNQTLKRYANTIPAIAPVQRALMAEDAPAVGAALLPFSHHLLPSRAAMVKTTAD